jgi:hypothetical protein
MGKTSPPPGLHSDVLLHWKYFPCFYHFMSCMFDMINGLEAFIILIEYYQDIDREYMIYKDY